MEGNFLKPPSFATWLLLAVCSLLLASEAFGGIVPFIAIGAVFLSLGVALYAVTKWLSRCIGYFIGYTTQSFVEGYREGYEEERLRSAARLASSDGSAETP
ncbi:MAG: hypothetical protein Q8L23_00990 [Caulobacter sp.]|nr:hypothetical protein [Caulobacter sp.]